jgi:hypothetical protein
MLGRAVCRVTTFRLFQPVKDKNDDALVFGGNRADRGRQIWCRRSGSQEEPGKPTIRAACTSPRHVPAKDIRGQSFAQPHFSGPLGAGELGAAVLSDPLTNVRIK